MRERRMWKKAFSEEEYQGVMRIAAKDAVGASCRALKTIIVFELIMMGYTVLQNVWDVRKICYFGGYLFLTAASAGVFFLIRRVAKDFERRYMQVKTIGFIYDTLLVAWAVYMTVLENWGQPNFSVLIFITVLVVIPAVTFLPLMQYLLLHICGCGSVFLIIWNLTEYGKFGNIVNFTVFAIISLISASSFYESRLNSYIRQVQLEKMADRDALSGLYNRQKLGRVSEQIWGDCTAGGQPLTCILCDIDDFKKINDNYGHLVGDQWIQTVSAVLKASGSKMTDLIFRYGGEEFMIVLPGAGMDQAVSLAELIQAELRKKCLVGKSALQLSLSFGIYTGYPGTQGSIEKFFSRADELMYEAKRKGKNQYCCSVQSLR